MKGATLLAADLHLDPSRPALTALATRTVERARGMDALWLLGDVFEAWIGDDAFDAVAGPELIGFADALGRLAASGTAVHLMHGNRDFLLGEAFADRVGATLHRDDEVVVELAGRRTVLLHGDTLCTDDVEYQRARPVLRSAAWQAEQLGKSVAERLEIARSMRERSRRGARDRSKIGSGDASAGAADEAIATTDIVDVSRDEVDARFAATGAAVMVHGHVHRPAEHAGPIDAEGRPARRLVVGDWRDGGAVVAVAGAGGIELTTVESFLGVT